MKKIYLTLVFFATFGLLTAQQANDIQVVNSKKEVSDISQAELQTKAQSEIKSFFKRNNNSKVIKSRWYNAAFTIDNVLGGIGTVNANNIFPDTTILVDYGTMGFSGPWIHSIAECVDPMSIWYSDPNELTINGDMPYTVDSIALYCIYERNTDATVVDTLLIQLRNAGTDARGWFNHSHFITNYGADTCVFRPVPYDLNKIYSTDAGVITFKYPLTVSSEGDTTSNGLNYFKVGPATPFNIGAGEQVIVTFGFIPGYTWTANVDTLTTKNRIRFISMEELGDDTYPTYTKGEWTSSYIQSDDDLFDPAPTSYTSHLGYMASYAYEHHWIELLLTADETSVKTNEVGILNVSQNHPNPFSGSTTINYNLDKAANVNVTIYNVAGAQVMTIAKGLQTAGNHQIQIDASNLPAGVYYYTFTADNNTATKKMIVY